MDFRIIMISKKIIFFIFIYSIFTSNLFSQQNNEKISQINLKNDSNLSEKKSISKKSKNSKRPEIKYQLGASASLFSGYGIAFQYLYLPNQRIKTIGFLWFNQNLNTQEDSSSDLMFSLGLEWQYDLLKTNWIRNYFMLGVGGIYSHEIYNGYYHYVNIFRRVSTGFAFGLELLFWKHVAFNIDLGLNYYKDWGSEIDAIGTGYAGAIGVSYAF